MFSITSNTPKRFNIVSFAVNKLGINSSQDITIIISSIISLFLFIYSTFPDPIISATIRIIFITIKRFIARPYISL